MSFLNGLLVPVTKERCVRQRVKILFPKRILSFLPLEKHEEYEYVLFPTSLLFFRKQIRIFPDNRCELGMHLGLRHGHKTIVRDFEVRLPVGDWLCSTHTNKASIVEESRVLLARELDAYVLAPVHEGFAITRFFLILVNVSYVVLRI